MSRPDLPWDVRLRACRRPLGPSWDESDRRVGPRTRAQRFPRSDVCRSRGVLLVGHVPEPGHDLALVVCLLDGDVSHEPAGRGAVPVFLAGLDVDDIPGPDLLGLAAAAGDVPDAVGDVEGLALGVVVPRGARAGGEPDVSAADRGLIVGVADAVDVDIAGEPGSGTGGGLGGLGVIFMIGSVFFLGSVSGTGACSDAAQEASSRRRSAEGEPGSAV